MQYQNPFLRGWTGAEQERNAAGANRVGVLGGLIGLQSQLQNQAIQQEGLLAKRQQQQHLERFASQLPPEEQAKFRVAPLEYIREANKKYVVSGALVPGSGGAPIYQAPREMKIAPSGQVYDPTAITPGQVFNDPNKLMGIGAGGVPSINQPLFDAKRNIAAAGKTTVSPTVIVDKGQGKYAETLGGKSAEADLDQFQAASSAVEGLDKINSVIEHLKKSDARTGLGAELLKNVDRARVFLLNEQKAGRRVSDTELLDSMLGSDVFPMIKALGIGARGMDTPQEREFLRQVMTGTVSMNKDTLIRMAEIRKNVAERAVERWNERVQRGEVDRFFEHSGRQKGPLAAPYSGPDRRVPSGVDPKVWSVMTPEERALWK